MSDLKKTIADLDPIDEVNLNDELVFSQTGVDGRGAITQLFEKLESEYFNSNFQDNFVGVVQSIQNGKVNLTTNESEVLTESSGIITLNASSITFRCNIADGYSNMGKKAVRLNLSENLTKDLSSEADGDYYIYLVYDKTAETVSLEYSQIARVMSTTPPSSPSSGDLWYDINNNKVFESDGSTWTQVYKLVLGMVNKSGTTYTIYNRAFNDYYESELTGLTAGNYVDFFHNLFTKRFDYKIRIYQDGSSNRLESNYYFVLSGSGYGQIITSSQGREDMKIRASASNYMFGGGTQSGDVIIFLKRSF